MNPSTPNTRTFASLGPGFRKALAIVSYVYLALPLFIFAVGWLKPAIGVAFAFALSVGLFLALRDIGRWQPPPHENGGEAAGRLGARARFKIAFILAATFAWTLLSGIGGYGFQRFTDYLKHNALLHDLAAQHWPVHYASVGFLNGATGRLGYYLAYYLPPGLAGRWFGKAFLNPAVFVWSFLGVLIGLCWFFYLVRRLSLRAFAMFVLFGGMNYLASVVVNKSFPSGTNHVDTWFGWATYPPFTATFFWAPQHMIPGWILSGMLLSCIFQRIHGRSLVFLWSLSVFWSPFLMIGLFPFVVYAFVAAKNRRDFFSYENTIR
jgi:hypothetical protein